VSDTRWLTDEQQRTWRALLMMVGLLQEELERELQQDAGMPHAYYMILATLSEAPERALRMTDLSQVTRFSLSRLSHAVARLEEAGWVTRTRCPTDRRGFFAVLTDAGYDVLAAAAPGHVETVRRHVFDPLTDAQVTQLHAICEAVLEVLDSDGALRAAAMPRAR
jgi:DNA-binding MarR family transcriptional regulator